MGERPVSDQFVLRLKAQTRDLIKMCGGLVRAGEVVNRSKSEVSRWQSVTDPDVIDLCSAMVLEAECGQPLVTSVMAEASGRRLSDGVAEASAASVLERHAEVMRRAAEAATKVAIAMADNVVTPTEAEGIDRTLADLEVSIRAMRASCATIRADGAADAGALVRPFRAV